jgi:dipeptidyl aminopeptidase/acylaminoacyl peptidase
VYYRDGDWHLLETESLETRNLTSGLEVRFSDEDWDYPQAEPGYGVGAWVEGSASVLINDKFDIWEFPTGGGQPVCLTEGEGRRGLYQFRIRRLDKKKESLARREVLFLSAYHDSLKHTALFRMRVGTPGVKPVVEEDRNYRLVARAKDADRILFTRQSYTEFPDLWVTTGKFKKPLRLSEVNPQVSDFDWGQARLVDWKNMDGRNMQGILITPEGHQPGERLPVLVYYYRFFSQRLHNFNHVAVNHRPCFPYYVSNGYAVFLPDIRFDIGNPGYAATKNLVPGVQKIIDMGVADPENICLHGHSWSGYQTAQVITQTDLFACAIAGAPVSNMTSAYNGIRWESGRARQFQYEKEQSRIGGSLWEARDKYIENSPVFFADRINTPLLIMFGDKDGAVPWYQGIELYLAMRRLDKDCIFLQYRDEPHHLTQYANKLDYTIKFKEYLDHHLKGEPAADWIKKGIPYQGN